MRKLFPLLFAATALADAPQPSTEDALVTHLSTAKFTEWKTPNSSKGSEAEVIGHQFTCGPGADCLLLTRRAGPTNYNFVK